MQSKTPFGTKKTQRLGAHLREAQDALVRSNDRPAGALVQLEKQVKDTIEGASTDVPEARTLANGRTKDFLQRSVGLA